MQCLQPEIRHKGRGIRHKKSINAIVIDDVAGAPDRRDSREMKMKWSRLALAALALALPQAAHALTIDFSQAGPAGNLGSNTYTNGPITVSAFYLNGNNYTNALSSNRPVTLFVRNEPFHDMGFGVCSPKEQTS